MDEISNNPKNSFLSNQLDKTKKYIIEHKIPIITSFVVAFLCHTFAFTNKLVNHDEAFYLFGKGETVSSGRWGLALTSALFPDISMPWIYGIISIVFITLAICLIIDIFKIKNGVLSALLSGLIMSFPSLTSIFTYMFTSASFSLCFLLSVLAVYLAVSAKTKNIILAVIVLMFSVSIYQAYIAIAASLLVVFLLQQMLLTDEDVVKLFKKALMFVVVLGVALALYYGINTVVMKFSESGFNGYASESLEQSEGIFYGLLYAYYSFLLFFTGKFSILANPFTKGIHIILFAAAVCIFIFRVLKKGDLKRKLLSIVTLGLFPLSITCLYLIVSKHSVHGLMMYSFISIYVFIIICINSLEKEHLKRIEKNIVPVLFAICIMSNVYTANSSYTQMKLAYENAYSYYSSVMTTVINTPGFDQNCKVALVRSNPIRQKYDITKHYDENAITGVKRDLINVYSRESFIKYFLAYDVNFATEEEIEALQQTDEFKEMAIYPYYGSVKKLDNYIVVRLSE